MRLTHVTGTGFDTPRYLTPELCDKFQADGAAFVFRYVTRWRSCHDEPTADLKGDWFYGLSKSELALIMESGLALGVVQACRMSCELSAENGHTVGVNARENCLDLGIPLGATIFCDAEFNQAPSANVIAYLNAWADAVRVVYRCGLYVGYDGLSSDQLYGLPRYTSYWASAMTYIGDPQPRGYATRQDHELEQHGIDTDPDTMERDGRGELPYLCSA